MTTILHIDSSILGGYSVSRTLTAEIVAKQEALHPGARVIRRDLVVDAAMHLSDAHMVVFQGGEVGNTVLGQDLATGGAYIDDRLPPTSSSSALRCTILRSPHS